MSGWAHQNGTQLSSTSSRQLLLHWDWEEASKTGQRKRAERARVAMAAETERQRGREAERESCTNGSQSERNKRSKTEVNQCQSLSCDIFNLLFGWLFCFLISFFVSRLVLLCPNLRTKMCLKVCVTPHNKISKYKRKKARIVPAEIFFLSSLDILESQFFPSSQQIHFLLEFELLPPKTRDI